MQYGLHVRTLWTALSVFIQVLQLTWEYCCLFLEKLDATLQRKFFLHWLPVLFQDGQEDEETTWFFAIPYVENRCKNNEKAQCTCGYETIQNFKDCTGTSKRQTGKGRLNRMCVRSSLLGQIRSMLGQIRSVSVRFGKLQDRFLYCVMPKHVYGPLLIA